MMTQTPASPPIGDSGRLRRVSPVAIVVVSVIVLALGIEIVRVALQATSVLVPVGLVITIVGALLVRRRPFSGLAVSACGTLLTALAPWTPLVEWSVSVFLVFLVTYLHARPVRAAVCAAIPTVASALVSGWLGDDISTAFATLVTIAAAAAIGAGLRTGRLYRETLEQRAEDAIMTRELEATRRVAEERIRIARDLHDVVGHEVAVVSMNLGIIEVSVTEPEPAVVQALASARDGVRNVLSETQRMLVLLRTDSDVDSTDPVPDLSAVPALIDSYRSLGLTIHTRFDPDARRADAVVQLTVYRILQEALTNARRYGRGEVTVSCRPTGGKLEVVVCNQRDPGSKASGTGLGLVGMTERVTALGGRLDISRPGDDFVVTALLPLRKGRQK